MKINVKTLKGTDFFEITLDETATVNELKDKIAADKSKERDTIKLVHKGKQLNDDAKTLGEVGIKDNDFIILMVFAKKSEKQEEVAKDSASTATTSENANKPPVSVASNVQAATIPATSANTASSTSAADNLGEGSELLQGAELEEKVKEMQDMGFERPKIMQALKAAYYNPERAVDYLLSGNIPTINSGPIGGAQGQPGQGRASNEQLQQLAQLTQNPQFQQIAQAIRQNPALLQPVMAQLAQSNPEVARIIQQNPQEFIQLLLGIGGGAGQQGGQLPRGAIQVTPEEKADIDEIISLGFDKNDALEAYISCDKNKELAINYLFDAKDSGALLSEHIQKEEEEAVKQESAQEAQQPQQPPANQNNPPQNPPGNNNNPPGEPKKDKDDEDDFMYQ